MKYTAYANRKETDALFTPADGSAVYSGQLSDAVRYIEGAQLLDPEIWALFVEQFRQGDVDDHDLGWRSEYWGKMMRGACFTYAYTQNEELYQVLEDTVRDLLTTQDKYGRFTTYSFTKEFHGWDVWGRKYVLLGFQYFLEICKDDELADTVIKAMKRHADYMIAKIGNGEVGKMPVTNTSEWWHGLNASSVMEPFVRLYNLTGEKRYLDFAKGIIDAGGISDCNIFEIMLEGKTHPYELPVTKAYEMISNFEGIIEYYRVTREEKYKTMVENFARLVIESDITVIGSAGTTHELFDHSIVNQFDPAYNGIMQETCVTVTWMKFCWQMLCLTGDSKYADQIETSVYNALMGAINVEGNVSDRGQLFNFDSYSPLLNGWRGRAVGGYKDFYRDENGNPTFGWGCCVAIGAAGTGLIPMTAVMPAKDGIAVNLFIPGISGTTLADGTSVALRVETDYPIDGKVRIIAEPENEAEFTISVRIPAWSTVTALTVNGDTIACVPGTYAKITRVWEKGDEITVTFDMRTKIIRAAEIAPDAKPECICHAALRRGPVMLARDSQLGEDVTEAVTLIDENGYA
ncbi:MAG: glycoside hydrolase family 127 protein, partial [Clostridia bacterium]|nr:glycoside hydrolase family 127 protein [Clostridia bacterium]